MEYRKDYKELGLTREDLVEMYRTMNLIRNFELTAVDYFKKGIVIGNQRVPLDLDNQPILFAGLSGIKIEREPDLLDDEPRFGI